MPGGRPDPEVLRRNAQVVFGGAGETARLRVYVSAQAGPGKFGAGNAPSYTERVVTGIVSVPRVNDLPVEHDTPGGQVQAAPLLILSLPDAVGPRDELIWRGTAFRIAGQPLPEVIGGRVLWRNLLTVANTAQG